MTNEEKAKAFVSALQEKDQAWHEALKALRRFEEAQSRAWELELVCFEHVQPMAAPPTPADNAESVSISKRVLAAFDTPKRLPQVAGELGLTRQQVQTAVSHHMYRARLKRVKWGLYVRKDV